MNWWRSWGKDIVACILIILVAIGMVVGIVVGVLVGFDRPTCLQRAQVMGVECRWGLWTGCMYQIGDKWIPSNQYIINAPTR